MPKKFPRVLFTTQFIEPNGWFEYFSSHTKSTFRLEYYVKQSYGLRYIKQNFPQIKILEYPTREEYERVLEQGWDIVGFSFFTQFTDRIKIMAEKARQAGVKELWAGSYGVANTELHSLFDRVFVGYPEREMADIFEMNLGRIRIPPIVVDMRIPPLPFTAQIVGVIHGQRGCPMKCSFCNTPMWTNHVETLDMASVDETLRHYASHGIDWVGILDEYFGVDEGYTLEIVRLIKKYNMFWTCQTRTEAIEKYLDYWTQNNLMGVGVGVESTDPQALNDWKKQLKPGSIPLLAKALRKEKRYLFGYYMIGNERATYESTINEIDTLSTYNLDFLQLTVATPFPGTGYWDDIESRFGIFETDWEKFDTNHLVWNHPHITPSQMDKLMEYACRRYNTPDRWGKFIWRIYECYSDHLGSRARGLKLISQFPFKAYKYGAGERYLD